LQKGLEEWLSSEKFLIGTGLNQKRGVLMRVSRSECRFKPVDLRVKNGGNVVLVGGGCK